MIEKGIYLYYYWLYSTLPFRHPQELHPIILKRLNAGNEKYTVFPLSLNGTEIKRNTNQQNELLEQHRIIYQL